MSKEEVLLGLDASTAHKEQIEAWKRDLEAFEKLKADHEDELRRVRGEAYQVASWYAVFQGVVFTAVSQASLLTCSLSWSPISLSVAMCVAAVLAIADHLYNMGEVKEDIKETGLNMSAIVECIDRVEAEGCCLDLEIVQPVSEYRRNRRAGYDHIRSLDGFSALCFLAGFSFLIAYFSKVALCRHCRGC